jgi:ATP-dependent HslUV protease ATP-binding subunit HslU
LTEEPKKKGRGRPKKSETPLAVIASDRQLTPSEIVEELDKYVIGQDGAKKSVAIALRNRWRRQQAKDVMKDEIMPNNIIMIGPTGVGKTEIARRLSKLANAPLIKVEASKFTEVGYVGRDVESMIRELTDLSVNIVKAEKMKEVQIKAEENADEKILDIIIPVSKKHQLDEQGNGPDKEAEKTSTRDKLRTQLKNGELDNRSIELDVSGDNYPMLQVLGPLGLDEMGINLNDLFGNMMPKKAKKRKMNISEARKVLTQEESGKLIDMDAVVREAISKVENSGIVFIDEIDKVAAGPSKGMGPDVSREGVQRDLLPIVEGSTVITKYGAVKTDHILFIASGAFHTAKPSDLIPELQGRFPIRVELANLGEDDFIKILTQPENALIKQYKALFESEQVTIEFTEEAIREIARIAAQVNEQVENIGARRLHTILTTVLEELLFSMPDKIDVRSVTIDKAYVNDKLNSIVKNRDLSRYIL